MRLFGPSGVREFPSDRNPATIAQGDSVSTAGGVATTLATYTVPAGRSAHITWAHVAALVTTVLGAAQTAFIRILIVPSGGASQEVGFHMFQVTAAVGTERQVGPGSFDLRAGDLVEASVLNNAGTGVVQSMGGINGVEYDA